jgi:hypothetical protein
VAPDYSRNGVVDAADFTTLRSQYGQVGSSLAADGNGDGRVDGHDMLILQRQMGKNVGVLAAMVVPEPGTLALIAVAGVCGLACKRRNAAPDQDGRAI